MQAIRVALGVYCLEDLWCGSHWKKRKRREDKSFVWMSSDSRRFWEHPTFQMCTFQLLLLSDRTGGDTFILKILDELQSSSLSHFYVLHQTEWCFFYCYILVWSSLLRLSFPEAEKIYHNRETAAGHRWRHYLLFHNLEDEEGERKSLKGQHWIFPVWQNSLKYLASFSHLWTSLIQSRPFSLTEVGMGKFKKSKHL